jgi:hypothetical protein
MTNLKLETWNLKPVCQPSQLTPHVAPHVTPHFTPHPIKFPLKPPAQHTAQPLPLSSVSLPPPANTPYSFFTPLKNIPPT